MIALGKVLEIDGQAGIQGIAFTVNECRPGKQRRYQTEFAIVCRHFVDHVQGGGGMPTQQFQVGFA